MISVEPVSFATHFWISALNGALYLEKYGGEITRDWEKLQEIEEEKLRKQYRTRSYILYHISVNINQSLKLL